MPSKLFFKSIVYNKVTEKQPGPPTVMRHCYQDWFFKNQIESGKSVEEVKQSKFILKDKVIEMQSWNPPVFTEREDPQPYIDAQVEKYADLFSALDACVVSGEGVYLEDFPLAFDSKKEGVRAEVKDGFIELWITLRNDGNYNFPETWYEAYHKVAEISAVNKHGERLLSRCPHGYYDFQEL